MSRVGGKGTKGRGQQNLLRTGLEGQGDLREAWGLGRETRDGLLGEPDMPSWGERRWRLVSQPITQLLAISAMEKTCL